MARVLEAQITFANVSALPEDQYVNTLWFNDPDSTADLAALADACSLGLFKTSTTAGFTLGNLLSGRISRAADSATVKIYDHSAAPPRVPIHTKTWNPTAAGTAQNLPEEVALCISFRGQLLSGTNAARRRGRIYLGPLCRYAAESTVGSEDRPEVDNFPGILELMQNLHDDAQAAGVDWVVYSRTDNAPVAVSYVWIDNAFDTQRRRGQKATARTGAAIV